MKKAFVILVAVAMFAATGCQKQEEAGKIAAPPAAPPQAAATGLAPQPGGSPSVGDPHAGLKLKGMVAGSGHKGKVLQVMDAGAYTYLEVEEKGQKFWVAALKTKVNKGAIVEFPDSNPMVNFESKSLKKTFDKIFLADSLRVVK